MKVVIAIDSLKGSLSSLEAGAAVREGILRADPSCEVAIRPLADGGEGTVEALTLGMGGKLRELSVKGPLGENTLAVYGILPASHTAILEISQAAGITLVPKEKRNPLHTTSFGVGEMILDAVQRGCRRFIVGIGGSATNDGGIGMLQALGYEFLDASGKPLPLGAEGLKELSEIRIDKALPELRECRFRIACDVTNPLCGENGCSAVFGPQKGADPAVIPEMDRWLSHYAKLSRAFFETADPDAPGAGAAGGLGFAFLSYTNAVLESGVRIVLKETRLSDFIKDADLVITGEGRLDAQTIMGKAPIGVAGIAKKYGKPVIAFSGSVSEDAVKCNAHGIDAFFPILRRAEPLSCCMEAKTAKRNLADTAEQVFRLLNAARQLEGH